VAAGSSVALNFGHPYIPPEPLPRLLDRCAALPWHRVPVLDRTRDRAHGRLELRTLKAATVNHFGSRTPHKSSR
jgi:hypothetical protein